ncbi:uncharacterized protein LOC143301255 isoform X2 [Babylonia areolata]
MKVTDIQVDVVFILIIGSVCCRQTCVLPLPGKCSSDNYTIDGNEVCELNAGSCDFNSNSGLCLYQQGCADPPMSNWTLVGGQAQARQEGAGICPSSDYYYSVLESPWLHVTHPSCLKFSYSRAHPAALDVFLDHRDGRISTVLNRSNNAGYNVRNDVKWNVDPGIRKIVFRAYGGGGGSTGVRVFSVSVDPWLCEWSGYLTMASDCIDDVPQRTSPLISPTESDRVDCLKFSYSVPSGSNLTVSVQLLNEDRTVAVWGYSVTGEGIKHGVCPLQVHAAYKILFNQENPQRSAIQFSVVVTGFSRHQRTGSCPLSPSTAVTSSSNSVVRPSVLSQPRCSIPSSSAAVSTGPVSSPPTSTASGTTLKGSSHSQDHSTSATPASGLDDEAEDKPSSTVIALAVSLAVSVAALLGAVVVIMWLRRKIHTGTAEIRRMGTHAFASVPETADGRDHRAGDDAIAPSVYDITGELSPPNPYSTLQETWHLDVIDTSATPHCDVSIMGASSYYNMGGNTQSADSPYYVIGGPVTSPVDDDEENNDYEV